MKLTYVDTEFPSRVFSNEDILEQVKDYSKNTFEGDTDHLVKNVRLLLELSGARTRRWISTSDETNQLITSLIDKTRKQLQLQGLWNKSGLIIAASVDRVFSEPGDSYFYANQLGLADVHCLDLLDACNSHMRAWQLGQALLKSKAYDWILVISCECRSGIELLKGKFKERYSFINKQELAWKFPALTLGDAISVSLLVNDSENNTSNDWCFEIESKTSNAPLCYANSTGPRHFEHILKSKNNIMNSHGDLKPLYEKDFLNFFCQYSELERESVESVVKVWKKFRSRFANFYPSENEWLISHCSNGNGWAGAARWAGFTEKHHINLYAEFGNIVSCSVPASIALSNAKKLFSEKDKLNIWTGAAGSSYFAFQIPFQTWENN